jgi:hypothetical protein
MSQELSQTPMAASSDRKKASKVSEESNPNASVSKSRTRVVAVSLEIRGPHQVHYGCIQHDPEKKTETRFRLIGEVGQFPAMGLAGHLPDDKHFPGG